MTAPDNPLKEMAWSQPRKYLLENSPLDTHQAAQIADLFEFKKVKRLEMLEREGKSRYHPRLRSGALCITPKNPPHSFREWLLLF